MNKATRRPLLARIAAHAGWRLVVVRCRVLRGAVVALLVSTVALPAASPRGALPTVPPGFEITVFAGEPLIYKPTSLCFDDRGRLLVGQGPQYHLSKAVAEPDSVVMLLDTDGDGVADQRKVFATGFNSIQGLAWKGGDLYVANSPELTVVRDRDGDGVADEYTVVYTDLGNHEHAIHGLNWGPDGRLYMSKGNSKGHNQPEKNGRVAPKAFRELWDVAHPPGAPDIPEPRVFTADTYRKTFHDPADDWGREGGVLRCDPMGKNLEIVARGMRNPWDIALDAEFNWLGTDNDQTQGDRIIMPFMGAHFGWGHRYSSHWTGIGNLPTVPVSGPMTSGSWVGIVYYSHPHFPAEYRDVFLINDWMYGTYVYRPGWDGALRQASDGVVQPLIRRSEGGMLYRPTDLDFGPDGSLYSLGWGGNYHYESGNEGGWVFRLRYRGGSGAAMSKVAEVPVGVPSARTVTELIQDLGADVIPVRRVNAQDELVRRGAKVRDAIVDRLNNAGLDTGRQTWAIWALGRMEDASGKLSEIFQRIADPAERYPTNLRLQSLRILGDRAARFGEKSALSISATAALRDSSPRIRFEAIQSIRQAGASALAAAIVAILPGEQDRLVFYAGWQALRDLASLSQRRTWLAHASPRVRLAALLGLQEDYAITLEEVLALVDRETDLEVQSWALTYAMNPVRPEKMPNTTARVVLEQSVPINLLLKRANEAREKPALRKLYLQMIARTSVRLEQRSELVAFYRTLQNDEERTIIWPALSAASAALPLAWDALAGPEDLREAAIRAMTRMGRLANQSLPTDESDLRKKTSNLVGLVISNDSDLADWLLQKLAGVEPSDARVPGAVRVLGNLAMGSSWRLSPLADARLAILLTKRTDPASREALLRFLARLQPTQLNDQPATKGALEALCAKPDPQLFQALQAAVRRLELPFKVPEPEAATAAGVLTRLATADPSRGRHLFFDSVSGAGCAACHRIAGVGSEFAPDLTALGMRLTPDAIVEAILRPSASITEGYDLHQAETRTENYLGAIVREDDREIVMVGTDGRRFTVKVSEITQRRKLNLSVMPPTYAFFGNQAISDLTAFLQSLRN